jgi:predicted nucleotidyltransferase
MSAIEHLRSCVPGLLREFSAVELLYVFGSQASGQASSGSDVDVAVLLDEHSCRHDPLLDLKIALYLEDALGQSVDVVVLNKASTILQHEVVRTGRRLYESSAQRRRAYELGCFKAYTDVRHYQRFRQKGAVTQQEEPSTEQ